MGSYKELDGRAWYLPCLVTLTRAKCPNCPHVVVSMSRDAADQELWDHLKWEERDCPEELPTLQELKELASSLFSRPQ